MRLLIALVGFVLGGLAAILLVVLNPLASQRVVAETSGGELYSYTSSDMHGMHRSGDGLLGLAWLFQGPADYDDPAIRNTVAATMVLRDSTGEAVAFATRLSATTRDGNLLLGRAGMRSYWNIFWPNQGSIYMQSEESRWAMVQDSLLSAVAGKGLIADGDSYVLTAAEPSGSNNEIIGISGALDSVAGSYTETLLSPGDGAGIQQGELQIELRPATQP